MRQPLLSIIIAMHNNAATLDNCIGSFYKYVENQPVEIICIDDHSTDNSIDIVKKYSKISIFNLEGHGLGVSRNCGISHATGQYIWFIDADDELNGKEISYLLNKIATTQMDLYIFGLMKINGDKKSVIINKEDRVYHKTDNANILNSIFKDNAINSACNKLYKRSIIIDFNLTFDDVSSVEDILFNCKYIPCVETIETLNKVLYLYYIYSNTSTKWKWYQDKEMVVLKMLAALNDFSQNTNYMSLAVKSRIATDSAIGVEINILNKKRNFLFYRTHFKSEVMKEILSYCKPLKNDSIHYFVKSIIAKSLYLSYIYIRGIHNA